MFDNIDMIALVIISLLFISLINNDSSCIYNDGSTNLNENANNENNEENNNNDYDNNVFQGYDDNDNVVTLNLPNSKRMNRIACKNKENELEMNHEDLKPKEIGRDQCTGEAWWETDIYDAAGELDLVMEDNFIKPSVSSLRNANYDIRAAPEIPKQCIGPWLNTTIEPNGMGLKIGGEDC